MKANDNCTPLELYFSGRNLKNLDMMGKSDPYLTVSLQKSFHGNIEPLGKTETVYNNANPNWSQKLFAQYSFENKQPMLIEVFDEDKGKSDNFIGKVQTTLGTVMGASQQTLFLKLFDKKGKQSGDICVRAQKSSQSIYEMRMDWRGQKIANVDSFLSKSDPYLKFYRVREDTSLAQNYKTEVLQNNSNPHWKPFCIPANRLLDLNIFQSSFKVECWDHDKKDNKHSLIGQIYVSSQDLKNKQCPMFYEMQNPKIKQPGCLILERFQMATVSPNTNPNSYNPNANPNSYNTNNNPTYPFIDFLKSGLQINLAVAIDFTASNGNKENSTCLHYMNNQPNQYQQVIKGIWDIVEKYDSDKKIPAFGFGAKPHFPNHNLQQVSHCFPLNDNSGNPQINGFDQLMNMYSLALQNMSFSGPTYFAPILEEAFKNAKSIHTKQGYCYQIFLIVTDGSIHDMQKTKDLIVQNANLPVSIVIVGVGKDDFSAMRQLDGDEKGLCSSKGLKCPRDIVQFVPYLKYNGNYQQLTQEILKEVPNQISQYFSMINRPPQPQQNQQYQPQQNQQYQPQQNQQYQPQQTNPFQQALGFLNQPQ